MWRNGRRTRFRCVRGNSWGFESLHRQIKKIRKKKDVVLITPVVLSEQRRFTLRVSCLVGLAGSSTMQAESLHRQIKKNKKEKRCGTHHPCCSFRTTEVHTSSILPRRTRRLVNDAGRVPSSADFNTPSLWERVGVRVDKK